MIKTKIIIIGLLLLLIGCSSGGTFGIHPCNAPFSYNISCQEAEACYGSDDFEPVLDVYYESICVANETWTLGGKPVHYG